MTRKRVEEKLKDSPQSSLQETLATLDAILKYTESVKSDSDKFSEEKIREYNIKINIINENIERFLDKTLLTDVSFPLGGYKLKTLTKAGKKECDELVDQVISSIQNLLKKYPDQHVKITFKTSGYTDEVGFNEKSFLVADIREALGHRVPKNSITRRKEYNKILSKFRAASLNKYLILQLQDKVKKIPLNVQTEAQNIGLGETLPSSKVSPSYKAHDKRRRICIISPYIEIVL